MSPPPSSPEPVKRQERPRRRPSFNFLHRSKSVERLAATRSSSGGKLTKKQPMVVRDQELIPQQPPKIPDLPRPIQLQTFGGEITRGGSMADLSGKGPGQGQHQGGSTPGDFRAHTGPNIYNVPIPPIPGTQGNGGYVDPYARSESMTHRGRYSYASSAISTINSPRRVRRRKDPTPFKYVSGAVSSVIGDLLIMFVAFSSSAPAVPVRLRF